MTRADYQNFDYIIGMDHYNLSGIRAITGGDPEGKVHLLLDFTGRPRDIADPGTPAILTPLTRMCARAAKACCRRLPPGADDEPVCLFPGVL